MYIPVFDGKSETQTGITEAQFNEVIDKVSAHYGPIIEDMGGTLDVARLWDNGTVNASAQRLGSTWRVNMYGGLARHETMTEDGFMMVICHELGHHLGGAPKYGPWNGWASNEGQADYFAGLKCMKRVLEKEDNVAYVENLSDVNPYSVEKCQEQYADDNEAAICIRAATGGLHLAKLFQALRGQTTAPDFQTPDPSEVSRTDDRHPDTQCRLDTYFQGTLCNIDFQKDVSQSDADVNTCTRVEKYAIGLRPLCWYKPASSVSVLSTLKAAL
ncbi:MAG: hypothetical protein KDD50_07775 [Bdellovibrionales bacterium]|nr:hypothetical protein [Bdellovibrionales bacterium]